MTNASATIAVASGIPRADILSTGILDLEPGEARLAVPVTTSPLLHKLAMLPPAELERFVSANQGAVTELLGAPPAAREVSGWWRSLETTARSSLLRSAPQLIGNLEGVPYYWRNYANRELLLSSIEQYTATVESGAGRLELEQARRSLHMLDEVRLALEPSKSAPTRTLLTLDLTGSGRAAVVLGDLRTADYVSYLIPGMFFTVDGQIVDWTESAAELHADQIRLLNLLGDEDDADASVATIAWLGYETPNLTNVGGLEAAHIGRDLLAQSIEGLQALRGADQPYLSVLAHSYGATAALMALTEYDFEIDALAMVGSPGSAAQSVDELNVRNGNVFVGEAAWDPVPNSAFFGSDPGSPGYGAKPMGVAGGLDVITKQELAGSTGHNEYFGPNTESMRNLALIAIDKGTFVSNGLGVQYAKALARGL